MKCALTTAQLEQRLNTLEKWMAAERNPKALAGLNAAFERVFSELVRRDLLPTN